MAIVLDTIVARSLTRAIKQLKKEHPGCEILGIFDYYNY